MKKAEILERIGTECTYVRGRTYVNPRRAIVLDYGWEKSSGHYGFRGRAGYRRDGANGVAVAIENVNHPVGGEPCSTWYPAVVPASTLRPETYDEFTAAQKAEAEAERAKYRAENARRKALDAEREAANEELNPLLAELLGHSVYLSDWSDSLSLTPEDKRKLAQALKG